MFVTRSRFEREIAALWSDLDVFRGRYWKLKEAHDRLLSLDAVDGAKKAEREACAHVAETMDFGGPYLNTGPDYKQGKIMAARQIAEAIRAR